MTTTTITRSSVYVSPHGVSRGDFECACGESVDYEIRIGSGERVQCGCGRAWIVRLVEDHAAERVGLSVEED